MTMSEIYEKYTDIVVLKDRYSSHESRNSRSAFITAYWAASGGQIIEYRDRSDSETWENKIFFKAFSFYW